jgi:signal transduction protein with GAF and PtsI domain
MPADAGSQAEAHRTVRQLSRGARPHPPVGWVDRRRDVDVAVPAMQETLDRITYLAGSALDVEAVCAALVASDRRLFASAYGLPVPTALLVSHAFRRQVLASRRPLVVMDGRRDPLMARNPAVRDGTVRACLGLPLGTTDGRAVGTLLAMDQQPRRWTTSQVELLRRLSSLIVDLMELGPAVRRATHSGVGPDIVPVRWVFAGGRGGGGKPRSGRSRSASTVSRGGR